MAPRYGRQALLLLSILLVMGARAQVSPHGTLLQRCQDCHNTTSWSPLRSPLLFDHDSTGFALRGVHADLACRQCHPALRFTGTSKRCAGCHEDIHRGELGGACERCHTPGSWLVPDMAQRHTRTRFALVGPHLNAPCQACHTQQQKHEYASVPIECYGCHRTQYEATVMPSHRAAGFGTDCIQCHLPTALRWPSGFDHQRTAFPLRGAHQAVPCSRCHTGSRFRGTPSDCISCHELLFTTAANPNHVAGGFSRNCQTCHSLSAWRPAAFDHNATAFTLTGAHAAAACQRCHQAGVYRGTSTQCIGCHREAYTAALNPVHTPAAFPADCQACHGTTGWRPAQFDHTKTRFPLTGAHIPTACVSCHKNGVYAGTAADCGTCHESDFTGATNPAHVAGGFSRQCLTCHTTAAWRPAQFDHARTSFPLNGAHVNAACAGCHQGGRYAGTPNQCVGCHQQQFDAVTDPPHKAGGLSTQCQTCHTTSIWKPSTFNHSQTAFPLTGAHAGRRCIECHTTMPYASAPVECVGCHQAAFSSSVNPPHQQQGYPTDCMRCHSTTAWRPSSFNHAQTQFPLTGAHLRSSCAQCHKNGMFAGTPVLCIGCHREVYTAAANPVHTPSAFPETCTLCHATDAWRPAQFDHARTSFPLTGAHVQTQCARCHLNGVYAGTPAECSGCHERDFTGTTNPAHVTGGFSRQCAVCHTTAAWRPAQFDHNTTKFPLTGAHVPAACTSCHTSGAYAGTPVECLACHQTDFTGSANPPHVQQGYPTDCLRCHTTTAWRPSSFSHSQTLFPLTGAHVGSSCQQCHKNGVFAGTPVECVGCHQANFDASTNPDHRAAQFPTTCQTCHGTSAWTPSTFDHTKYFPISAGSKHRPGRWTTCADCHTSSSDYRVFSCLICHEHAQATMDSKHREVRGYAYDSVQCYRCHPTGNGD